MNMIQALNSAMDVMMERDASVVTMGEDVGYFGGVFRVTEGLQRKYGQHRVLDSPIAEGGIVATAIGMSVNGLRPVAEIQFADYIYPAYDQIVSELAHRRVDVVRELDFRHRLEPVHRHADGRGDDATLGDGRIEHTVLAVLALQAVGDAEHAAEVTDILAHHDHGGIARHHHVHGGVQRLDHVHLRHGYSPTFAVKPSSAFSLISSSSCSRWRRRFSGKSL